MKERQLKTRSPGKDGERRRAAPGEEVRCELCEREVGHYTIHHLVPRAAGGKFGPTAKLCPTCHRQLHALFSVNVLAKEMSSVKAIRANPEMAAYLRWARKQKEGANFRVRRAKNRR